MYSDTLHTILVRAPTREDIDDLTIDHAPDGVTHETFTEWVARANGPYVAFSTKTQGGATFTLANARNPKRWLLEFHASRLSGDQLSRALARALDGFQLGTPALEIDVLVPIAAHTTRTLIGFLRAGFDVLREEGGRLRLRRPAGLVALELAARWRA